MGVFGSSYNKESLISDDNFLKGNCRTATFKKTADEHGTFTTYSFEKGKSLKIDTGLEFDTLTFPLKITPPYYTGKVILSLSTDKSSKEFKIGDIADWVLGEPRRNPFAALMACAQGWEQI